MNFKLLIYLVITLFVISSCNRPTAKFLIEGSENLKAPVKVKFVNNSKKADQYLWNFGDGDTSTLVNPTHQYVMSGNYTIELIAKKGKKTNTEHVKMHVQAPEICLVLLETPFGEMEIELFDETPKHRDNFIRLAEEGFYENLLFHRVISGFMIQGGDPVSRGAKKGKSLGSGGPGYQIDAEFNPEFVHLKGALAAARTGGPSNPLKQSSGSQFYIVQGNKLTQEQLNQVEHRKGIHYTDGQKKIYKEVGGTPFLDMEYTVFGRVVNGLDVIDKIAKAKTNKSNRPDEDIWMKVKVVK